MCIVVTVMLGSWLDIKCYSKLHEFKTQSALDQLIIPVELQINCSIIGQFVESSVKYNGDFFLVNKASTLFHNKKKQPRNNLKSVGSK
jgi:hypothetical protein